MTDQQLKSPQDDPAKVAAVEAELARLRAEEAAEKDKQRGDYGNLYNPAARIEIRIEQQTAQQNRVDRDE